MSESPDATNNYGGHCYCGAIEFEVRLGPAESPIFSVYCHCDSCRRAHAAPLYQVACVDESQFVITRGQEQLREFTKPGGTIMRAFCDQCGTKICNRFDPAWKPKGKVPVAFFPNLLSAEIQANYPEQLRPTRHNQAGECVLQPQDFAELWPCCRTPE